MNEKAKLPVAIVCMLLLFSAFGTAVLTDQGPDVETKNDSVVVSDNIGKLPTETGTRSPAITTRSVLAELFTGTWCQFCPGGEGALDKLADEYPRTQLSILEYHVGDSYEVTGNSARKTYYDPPGDPYGYPTCLFDGIEYVEGGSQDPDDPATYNNYKAKIDGRIPIPSPVTITLTGSLSGGMGSITANITAIDDISPALTNLKVRFVIYDDHNYSVWDTYEFILRYTVVANLPEESISLSQYDNLEFTKGFSIDPGWDADKLGAVVFVQADSTKEVLQAVSLNLSVSDLKPDLALTPHDISFSNPNPNENQMVTISANIRNVGTSGTPSNVLVRFFDGDPSSGGTQIGAEQNAGILLPGLSSIEQVTWDTTGMAGDHEIVVVTDYPDAINEHENENNNKAPRFINVVPGPPPEVDFIQIRDGPAGGGIDLSDPGNYPSYPVGHITTFYAAGYNNSIGFFSDIDSMWISGDDTIVGVSPSGPSSTVTCSSTKDGTVQITVMDSVSGKMNTTDVTVLTPTLDYIQIMDAPGGGGSEVTTGTFNAYDTDTFYACGFNDTAGYLNDVFVDWTSDATSIGDVSPASGTSTTFTAQQVGMDSTCTVTANFGGIIEDSTGLLTVIAPDIDSIMIVDAPNNLGNEVTTATYIVWDTDNFYAAAYNDSTGYLTDVPADWSSNAPTVGDISPATGAATTFTAQQVASDSTCTVTATYSGHSDSTGLLTVLAPTIDEIMIRDAAGGAGNEITIMTYVIWQTDQFYAAAYNDSADFLWDVAADWVSDTPSVGDVTPATGTTTMFEAQDVAVDSTCTVTASYGIFSDSTGLLTVLSSTVDEIKIRDAPNNLGNEVTTKTYIVWDTDDFYAAAYNGTTDYLGDIVVDWSSDAPGVGDVSPATGTTTTFSAKQVGSDATCTITATYGLISDSTGLLTVLAPTIDDIKIRNAPNNGGIEVTTATYIVWETDEFYAASYNDTIDFISDVGADWSSDASSVGDVSPTTGTLTTFTAQKVALDATCTVSATFGGHVDSTDLLTVLAPTIDEIMIRDGPGGGGNEVTSGTYTVFETENFHATAYNDSCGYLSDVSVTWSSDNPDAGDVSPNSGTTTLFTALWVDVDETCIISADYQGILSGSTGTLTILYPREDYIRIENAENGTGNEVTTASYYPTDTDTFFAAAYNLTADFLYNVDAAWNSDDPAVGQVSSPGLSTTFTAQDVPGDATCIVNATYKGMTDSTGLLTVRPTLEPIVDYIVIMDAPGGSGNPIWEYANWPGESYSFYAVGDTDSFWAAGFNSSSGDYLEDVEVSWSTVDVLLVPDTSNGTVITGPAISTGFTANSAHGGALFVRAMNAQLGVSNTTDMLIIIPPTPDRIEIRDAPDGGGDVVTTPTYSVREEDRFYAAVYNDTAGYIGDVAAQWESDNSGVGSLDAFGHTTNFTALEVATDGTCTITITYEGLTASTGLILVLAPQIDEIIIRDSADGEGNVITTLTFDTYETAEFFAAAYNDTLGYLYDVPASWTCDPTAVGEVIGTGTSTTFTAQSVSTSITCTVTASYNGLSGSTGLLSINPAPDTTGPSTPGTPEVEVLGTDSAKLTWLSNTDPDLDKYIIKRSESPDGGYEKIAEVDGDRTSYEDTDLEPGKTYYYILIALDDSGNPSDESQYAEVETEAEPEIAFFWLLLLIIIVVVVIIVIALARRGKGEPEPVKPAVTTKRTAPSATKKKALPPPPKRRPPAKEVSKVPVEGTGGTSKPVTTPPPPPQVTDEELPPPPPPPQ
jgi:thiol-disulfide isomerase/thioredoxin